MNADELGFEPEGYYYAGKEHKKRTKPGEIDFDFGLTYNER